MERQALSVQLGGGLSASGGGERAVTREAQLADRRSGHSKRQCARCAGRVAVLLAGFAWYLFCSSDTSDWNATTAPQAASCNSGFRDSRPGT